MKQWWASGLAGALCVAPAFAQEQTSGFDRPYWLDRSVIEAIGRARLEAAPDRARFSVTFVEVAREAGEASRNAADRARLAEAAMRLRGGDAVGISSNLAIEPIYEQYRDREGVRQDSERADQIANYAASVTLNVEIREIARAADVRAAALAVGPQDAEQLTHYLRETTEMQRRVFGAAAEDAAARARLAAQASGARLGSLLALQEGQGPCLGRWYGSRPGYPDPSVRTALQRAPQAQMDAASPVEVVVTGSRRQQLTLTAEEIARLQLPADPQPITLEAQVCAIYAVGP